MLMIVTRTAECSKTIKMTPHKDFISLMQQFFFLHCLIPSVGSSSYLLYGVDSGSAALNTKFIGEALAARGRDVTFVAAQPFSTLFNDDENHKLRYKLIVNKGLYPQSEYDYLLDSLSTAALNGRAEDFFYDLKDTIVPMNRQYIATLLNNSTLFGELRNRHFDLAFFESMIS